MTKWTLNQNRYQWYRNMWGIPTSEMGTS